jgi:hypothetical protein
MPPLPEPGDNGLRPSGATTDKHPETSRATGPWQTAKNRADESLALDTAATGRLMRRCGWQMQ